MIHRCVTALVLTAAAASALGQATTNPAGAGAVGAYQPPRTRDAQGNVTGPSRVNWWNDVVFYEVFVRSFSDSRSGDRAGDGIGDIQGLIDRLDYLNDGDPATTADLGIGGLWLMPVTESPSYHGYDVVDYRTIERDYGTNEDFQRLLKACHDRGIKVIIDLVMNHTSSRHPAFIASADPQSPMRDWYIWSETDPGYKGPWNQRVWHRHEPTGWFYYGLFSADMPDVNYGSKAASDAMLDVVRFWLTGEDRAAIDGFRLDAIRHLIEEGRRQDNTTATHRWLREFRTFYTELAPQALCIGEVWSSTEAASSYVGDQLDMCFEFDLAAAMMDAARTQDAARVAEAQAKVLKWYPPNQYGRFLTNHDQPRVATQLKNDPRAMRAAAAMLLLGPGVPFIYYGEEIGMYGDKPDPDIRTPMQWTADDHAGFSEARPWRRVNTGFGRVNVAAQAEDADSILSAYRNLIRLRNSSPALRSGAYVPVDSGHRSVYSFLRRGEGDQEWALVIINLGDKSVTDYGLAGARSPLREQVAVQDLLASARGVPAEGGAGVPSPRTDLEGGFARYRPIGVLEPGAAHVLVPVSGLR